MAEGRSPPSTAPKAFLPSLQWLRAAAALMVVVHHADHYADELRLQSGQAAHPLFGFGSWWFGIHIFFVISGFIMVHTTPGFGRPGAWRRFLLRRIVRVVPLYWVLTSAMVVIVAFAPGAIDVAGDRLPYVVQSYLFIPVLRAPGDLRPIMGQGWTLDYEMFFYACFALAMLLPRRWGLGALAAAFALATWWGRNLGVETPVAFTWTDGLLLEFLFGAGLGLAFERGWRLPGPAAALAGGAGLALMIAAPQGPTALVCGVPAALIVAGGVMVRQPRTARALAWLTLLGDASYSLYLGHTFVLKPCRVAWAAAVGDRLPVGLFLPAALAIAVAAGLLLYRFVERPLGEALHRLLLGRPGASPPGLVSPLRGGARA